ncbi:hypothetical protein [Microbacterium sp. NPDC087589]|uniref:hypothetical protein n=1 Tax=Microbacterium sp. NPDC087589 TaxID=3364191 RepID=UPI003827C72E
MSEPPPTLAALVLPSLVPVAPSPFSPREKLIADTALSLQMTAASPDSAGVRALVYLGVEWVDRFTEMLGRIGSAGEQLALALATNKDARRWTAADASERDPQYATMGVRAQAEMTALWTLGSAHGLANALVRALRLNTDARQIVDSAFPGAAGFPPFSETQQAWVSFEPGVMRVARAAAGASASPATVTIAASLSNLFGDKRWKDFLDLRNVGFHRHRPQSVDGGTPKTSSVTHSPTSYSISVGVGPSNVAPQIDEVLAVAEAGLDLYSAAARVFDEHLFRAINELSGRQMYTP